ncbi:MAG: sterol desaturase family protein [Planctomycetota bacterium]
MEYITVPAVIGAYALLFGLERLFPLREEQAPLGRRLLTNGIMTGLTFGTGSLLVRTSALWTTGWVSTQGVGLLQWLPLSAPLTAVTGFLLLDLTFYWWHRANHEIGLLWRFHSAHHVDPALDVTTAFRFHLVEIAYSTPFRVAQVLILGISPFIYLSYELVFQLATLFHHSNLRLPLWLERPLNKVVVTPRMHGIHHSQVRQETDSNYSVVFRFWDYLHRTLILCVPQSWVEIGVPGYTEAGDNRPDSVLLMPFRRQKPPKREMPDERRSSLPAEPTTLVE